MRDRETAEARFSVPEVWCDEDGDFIVLGTHDLPLARALIDAEFGEKTTMPLGTGWVVVGHEGDIEYWRHATADDPGAIPACGE